LSPSALKSVRQWKGALRAKGRRFAVVVSRFNEYLTGQLLENAVATLRRQGTDAKNIHVAHVPGAFEVPLAAQKIIRRVKPDAVLTLSVVIRGKTRHFDQVVTQCAKGVREVALETGVPVILGMVSAEDPADAVERVGRGRMNKGREWAMSAIEMANLSKKLAEKKRA
jgi:6,7-dimethyl-8-ribityllumazine synthase